MRQRECPQLFLGAYDSATSSLLALICSTLTSSRTLSHDTMSQNDPAGTYVAIHSVCVADSQRRKGVALALLKEYLTRLRSDKKLRGAVLISKENLVKLYEKAGFTLRGESEVVHGKDKWYELGVDFETSAEVTSEKPAVAQTDEDEGEIRNPGRKLGSSAVGGIEAVVDKETGTNSVDLFCPRAECRCLLLRKGAGKFVRGHKSDFEVRPDLLRILTPLAHGRFSILAQLPALPHPVGLAPPPSSSAGYFSVPSPLTFENIGFSRNAAPPSSIPPAAAAGSLVSSDAPSPAAPAANIKYLICADCDHGPLGWHDTEGRDLGTEVQDENEGVGSVRKGREFLLDVERLRYRV